tara:strand:- start:35 stop:514 length:480 start_codon:yes stop_codon:yes gene_type:complete
MPKNKIGGNKHKKGKNHIDNGKLRLKEKNEEYAKVISALGNCRFKIQCSDGIERIGTVRGNMRKKKYVNSDNIVLIEIWNDLQSDKCSIIDVYKEEHVKKLKKMKELPSIFEESSSSDYLDDSFNPFDVDDVDDHDVKELSEESSEEEEEEPEINLDEI